MLDHNHLHISRPWPGCPQWWFLFVWPASEIFSSYSPLFSTGNNDARLDIFRTKVCSWRLRQRPRGSTNYKTSRSGNNTYCTNKKVSNTTIKIDLITIYPLFLFRKSRNIIKSIISYVTIPVPIRKDGAGGSIGTTRSKSPRQPRTQVGEKHQTSSQGSNLGKEYLSEDGTYYRRQRLPESSTRRRPAVIHSHKGSIKGRKTLLVTLIFHKLLDNSIPRVILHIPPTIVVLDGSRSLP